MENINNGKIEDAVRKLQENGIIKKEPSLGDKFNMQAQYLTDAIERDINGDIIVEKISEDPKEKTRTNQSKLTNLGFEQLENNNEIDEVQKKIKDHEDKKMDDPEALEKLKLLESELLAAQKKLKNQEAELEKETKVIKTKNEIVGADFTQN